MRETVLTNALVVTEQESFPGTVVLDKGRIVSVDEGPSRCPGAEDQGGDMLIPGLIELHTDNLEKQLQPRPGVLWPSARAALLAHDAQIVAAGITTVLDAFACGQYYEAGNRRLMLVIGLEAVREMRRSGHLRAEHFTHARCELADPDLMTLFAPFAEEPSLKLVSLMDHTPGQRQYVNTTAYRTYYQDRQRWTDAEFDDEVLRMQEVQQRFAGRHAEEVLAFCREHGLPSASHDDATLEHVEWAHDRGMAISEFPTTLEAASRATELGLLTLMGAPNVVRGGSHSGNVPAEDVARRGCLGCLSSDYVPSSLLHAAWLLHKKGICDLSQAMNLVTAGPARAVGFRDRGRIAPELRADLVRLHADGDLPVIRTVWRDGQRVF